MAAGDCPGLDGRAFSSDSLCAWQPAASEDQLTGKLISAILTVSWSIDQKGISSSSKVTSSGLLEISSAVLISSKGFISFWDAPADAPPAEVPAA